MGQITKEDFINRFLKPLNEKAKMTHIEQLLEELKQLETSASQLTHESGIITFKLASNAKRQKLVKAEIEGAKALEAVSKQVKDDEEPDVIIKG